MDPRYRVVSFDPKHRDEVETLWRGVFGYDSARNDPGLAIDRKQGVADGLFFVAENEAGDLLGTVMGGYDGHRGWIYSLAVSRNDRNRGVGSALLEKIESALKNLGCVKINLQILEDNREVERFYRNCGYSTEKRISMGKEIPENIPDREKPV